MIKVIWTRKEKLSRKTEVSAELSFFLEEKLFQLIEDTIKKITEILKNK